MYEIRYEPKIVKRDLNKLDRPVAKKILTTIEKRLSQAPHNYGKILRHSLKGYWRLRVGDYRVIYEINENQKLVTIWFIDKRKDDQVYIEFLKQLRQSS